MGEAILKFKPRESLTEFTKKTGKVSLLRRTGGKKSSPNMAIYGENLASLAAMAAGAGTSKRTFEVDVIYIDPPYNVGGNQGYKNIWKGKSQKERDWAGDHGEFLDFMEPRLKIGRQLLTEEGIIFVSICDGEYCRLKILMDQVFGDGNCLGTIIWNKVTGIAAQHLSAVHEYILVYAKDSSKCGRLVTEKPGAKLMIEKAEELKTQGIPYEEAQKEFSLWIKSMLKSGNISKSESSYNKLHPITFKPFEPKDMGAQYYPCPGGNHEDIIHPITKKKYLNFNESFSSYIIGLTINESNSLKTFLTNHMNKPEDQMRWKWSTGDMVMWDNRVTMHYAVSDYMPHYRCMNRITVVNDIRANKNKFTMV